jgi:hypothetical protein
MNTQATVNEHPAVSQPAPIQEEQASPIKSAAAKNFPLEDSNRCQHLFTNRSRCRLLVSPVNTRFCSRRAKLPENLQPADVTSELFGNPVKMQDLDDIHDFLTSLLYLLSENRISTRRAAVLAYISNQLFRTLTAIQRKEDSAAPAVIFDGPRPIRD